MIEQIYCFNCLQQHFCSFAYIIVVALLVIEALRKLLKASDNLLEFWTKPIICELGWKQVTIAYKYRIVGQRYCYTYLR